LPRKIAAGNPADWMAFVLEDLAVVLLLLGNRVSFPVCRSKLSEAITHPLSISLARIFLKPFFPDTHPNLLSRPSTRYAGYT
jgi:hypothetical protein